MATTAAGKRGPSVLVRSCKYLSRCYQASDEHFKLHSCQTNPLPRLQIPVNGRPQLAIIASARRRADRAQFAIACQLASYPSIMSSNMPQKYLLVKLEARQVAGPRQLRNEDPTIHLQSQRE
jgi:hypothetical protein